MAVIGGGLAGVAAAHVLASRGASVTLFEAAATLGGRLAAWREEVAGASFEMDRGFHAFFRHYYNLRALLREVDADLAGLRRLDDYPVLTPSGPLTFAGVPAHPMRALLPLMAQVGLDFGALRQVSVRAALAMLTWDAQRTWRRWGSATASEWLQALRFPPQARMRMLDVFAHSFFNPTEELSAAELLMLFHYYFFANREGLVFDAATRPFGEWLWRPFARRLERLGVELRLSSPVQSVTRAGRLWEVHARGTTVAADAVVLATDPCGTARLAHTSPDLTARSPALAAVRNTRPFAVWRLWLDRPVDAARAPFAGTAGHDLLDNVSVYSQFHEPSRRWSRETGGSVLELHAYGLSDIDEVSLRHRLRRALHAVYPETAGARMVGEVFLLRDDCPGFPPGAAPQRPEVRTTDPTLVLAGDGIDAGFPCALMERAVSTGVLAANALLATRAVDPAPVWHGPLRGPLAALSWAA